MDFERQASFLTQWGYRLIIGSLTWMLGNVLIIFLLLNGVVVENLNEAGTIVISLFFSIPIFFAPGTIASFSCIRKLYNESDTDSVWKVYTSSYKKNYWVGFKQGCIYIGAIFVLYAAYWYYGQLSVLGYVIPMILAAVCTILFVFVLMYTSDRKESVLHYWKNSGLLLLNHPMFLVFMVTESFFVVYFCHYVGALLIFVAPGAVLLIVHHFYQEIIKSEKRKVNVK